MTDEIAIIDDDQEWLNTATQALTNDGYSVWAATSAEEGSNRLASASPALVFIAVQLPDYSGLHLLAEFRRRDAHTPVIVVSTEERTSFRDQALAMGATGFLRKPVSATLLLSAVPRFLRKATMYAE